MYVYPYSHVYKFTSIHLYVCTYMHFSNPEFAYMPPVSWNLIFNMRNSGMRQGGKDRCRLLRGRESYLKEGEVELPSPPALSEAGGGTGAD